MDHLISLYHLNHPLSNHQRNLQREHMWRNLRRGKLWDFPYRNVIKAIALGEQTFIKLFMHLLVASINNMFTQNRYLKSVKGQSINNRGVNSVKGGIFHGIK